MLVDIDRALAHALTVGMLDDAAVFPPGSADLADALVAHREYADSWFSGMVGPLVLPASALEKAAMLGADSRVAFTFSDGAAAVVHTLGAADAAGITVVAAEVALSAGDDPVAVIEKLSEIVATRAPGITVSVELAREALSTETLDALSRAGFRAKLRVGGVRAEMYPDELELARAILQIVRARVAFKATAGLHRAVRNTDPNEGFEQHGFLNLLLAAVAAADGASENTLAMTLAERDPAVVGDRVRELGEAGVRRARELFRSFGTCSIVEPIDDLVSLGLVSEPLEHQHPEADRQNRHES